MAQIVTLARIGVLVAAVASIAGVLLTMSYRLTFPFELNYMEGAMVDHVQRIVTGKPLYARPSLEFVPYLYPPGFYAASAVVSGVVGEGFLALRLVSAISSLGIFAILLVFVRRETGEWFCGLVSAGLFAATYVAGGTWFDVGRVDMLALFLTCAAVYAMAVGERAWTHIVAGLLIAAAFHTKQTAALMVAPTLLWLIVMRRRSGLLVTATAAVVFAVTAAWLDAVTGGWYRFYVFDLAETASPRDKAMIVEFWTKDILPVMGVAAIPAVSVFLLPGNVSRRLLYAAIVGGLLAGAWMNRIGGGNLNVFAPAFAAIAFAAGLGVHGWAKAIDVSRHAELAPFHLVLYIALLGQFAILAYDPREHVPSERSLRAGQALVAALRQTPGPIWVPYHGYLATMAGKAPQAHWMAVSDVLISRRTDLRDALLDEVNQAIREERFDVIVQSSNPFPNSPRIDEHYVEQGPAVRNRRALWPLAGSPRRPETLFVPKVRSIGGRPSIDGETAPSR